jgi:hypothetical protein
MTVCATRFYQNWQKSTCVFTVTEWIFYSFSCILVLCVCLIACGSNLEKWCNFSVISGHLKITLVKMLILNSDHLKISDSWLGLMILPGQWSQWMIVFQNPYDLVWVLSKFEGHKIPLIVLHDFLHSQILLNIWEKCFFFFSGHSKVNFVFFFSLTSHWCVVLLHIGLI